MTLWLHFSEIYWPSKSTVVETNAFNFVPVNASVTALLTQRIAWCSAWLDTTSSSKCSLLYSALWCRGQDPGNHILLWSAGFLLGVHEGKGTAGGREGHFPSSFLSAVSRCHPSVAFPWAVAFLCSALPMLPEPHCDLPEVAVAQPGPLSWVSAPDPRGLSSKRPRYQQWLRTTPLWDLGPSSMWPCKTSNSGDFNHFPESGHCFLPISCYLSVSFFFFSPPTSVATFFF